MNRAFAAWKWSLVVVTRSYRMVVLLAALLALWAFAAYEWLGLSAESSALLMFLSLIWAIVQLLAAVAIVGGTVAGAVEAATSDAVKLRLRRLCTMGWKKFIPTLMLSLVGLALVWVCTEVFAWVNAHSVEVASFLTFHSGKPVSHLLIEKIYNAIEGLMSVVISGWLLSFFIAYLRAGWREPRKQIGEIIAACVFRTPFLTSLLSVVVFGGMISELASWHPVVPAGFWDYTQLIVRFAAVVVIIPVGALFWSLSLAHLQMARRESAQI